MKQELCLIAQAAVSQWSIEQYKKLRIFIKVFHWLLWLKK